MYTQTIIALCSSLIYNQATQRISKRGRLGVKELSNNFEAELKTIEDKISVHREQLNNLGAQRRRLLEKMHDVDMDLVLQCIEEKGLSSKKVLELINSAEELT